MEYKVALIDDHELMRSGLAAMINGLDGYTVSIEASNGQEFIDILEHLQAPAIAVVDLHMPVMDGYATIEWIVKNKPEILPLALTFDASDDAMIKAIRKGARGFVRKNTRPEQFKKALDSLMLTGFYQTAASHERMTSGAGLQTKGERIKEKIIAQITPREMEFLLHVCSEEEPTYEMIAEVMGVHRRTVDNYRIALFDKFDIKSKAGLVLFAVRCGLLNLE